MEDGKDIAVLNKQHVENSEGVLLGMSVMSSGFVLGTPSTCGRRVALEPQVCHAVRHAV